MPYTRDDIVFEMREYSWKHRSQLCELCDNPALAGLISGTETKGFMYCHEHAHIMIDKWAGEQ